MLTHVHIKNFRSFVDAQTTLRPFTLVLGANGSGKSNFLKFFQATSQKCNDRTVNGQVVSAIPAAFWTKHLKHLGAPFSADLGFTGNKVTKLAHHVDSQNRQWLALTQPIPWQATQLSIYNPSPDRIAAEEAPSSSPTVQGDGSGTAQVLDALKTGDREDLFDKIEDSFRTYVPEVEKLSLRTQENKKQIQVREKGLPALPATELSEGTRLILCLLTILHQEKPPPIVLLEDIDRGLHPRLFEYVAPLIRRIAQDHDINIIATTHNPYLVDYFREDKAAVVLVEKENGESRLIPLPDRLKETTYSDADAEDMPLGQLWFSGLIGGTPRAINPQKKPA